MEKKYVGDHLWLLVNGDIVTVGLTEEEQRQLGDITFVDLPAIGTKAKKGVYLAGIESVKSATEVCAPVDGIVTEVNAGLESDPQIINRSPESAGWLFRIRTG